MTHDAERGSVAESRLPQRSKVWNTEGVICVVTADADWFVPTVKLPVRGAATVPSGLVMVVE